MLQKKNRIIFLTVIALILWSLIIYKVYTGLSDKKKDINTITVKKEVLNSNDNLFIRKKIFRASGRDPFSPFIIKKKVKKILKKKKNVKKKEVVKLPPWNIDGILWKKKSPIAVLRFKNSERTEMVKKGHIFEGITVLKIEKDKVHVSYKKKKFTIE